MKSTIRPSTYAAYTQHVDCHLVPHIGTTKLAKLTGAQVSALYTKLAETVLPPGREAGHAAANPAARPTAHARHTGAAGRHPPQCRLRAPGHATVSITLDTYSHAIPAMQEEAAALIVGLVLAAT